MDNPKKKTGPVPGPKTEKVSVLITPEQKEWGKHQPGGLSETIRRLIDEARQIEEKPHRER